MKVAIQQGSIGKVQTEIVLVGIFEESDRLPGVTAEVDKGTSGMLTEVMTSGDFKGKLNHTLLLYARTGIKAKRILLVGLGKKKDFTVDKLRGAASSGAQFVRELGLRHFLIPAFFAEVHGASLGEMIKAIVEGIFLGLYTFEEFKTNKKDEHKQEIESFTLLVDNKTSLQETRSAARRAEVIANAVYLVRDMVSHPANSATPTFLAKTAKTIAKTNELRCKILDKAEAIRLGMGSFLGVARGSMEPCKFIIVEYLPKQKPAPDTVVLVGKAITFDSGGISLKPAKGMEQMKDDMAGGAAVLGTLQAASQLNIPLRVVGLVPATENLPGGTALKPGDIVKSMSGKTIEIISTDAEGRLVLADALTYALRYKPKAIIDLATLTGACIIALGNDVAGMLGNDETLIAKIKEASESSGEKVWQLPLWEEYGDLIKSDVADIKNIGGRPAGTITGGYFLKEFVGNTPWVHLDIAGPAWTEKSRPYIPKGASGVGVRLMVQFLSDWSKTSKQKT